MYRVGFSRSLSHGYSVRDYLLIQSSIYISVQALVLTLILQSLIYYTGLRSYLLIQSSM